jgi:ATP-dependent Clp protease ATP-binding subunit ClpC
MFERYTEEARRVIFFARYEASNYGSPNIGTEHLLLGLLRERCHALTNWFPGERNVEPEIRSEIERRITPGKRISVSVEVPLSTECKEVLNLAADACERLGYQQIEPEHLLIALFRVETSLAVQVLIAWGLKPGPIQEQLAKAPSQKRRTSPRTGADRCLIAT